MRKNTKRYIRITLTAIVFAMFAAITSFAAGTFSENWYQSGDNWRIRDRNGYDIVNAWVCDDAVPENGKNVWYLIDGGGNMYSAGLVQDGTGNYYSIETNHNGYYGMLRYQSGTYDGIYLDLEQAHDGAFGAVKNQAGIDALKAKYGVTKFDIGNGNIVYTSDEKIAKTVGNTAVTAAGTTAASTTSSSDLWGAGTFEWYDPKKHDPDNYYKNGGAIPDYVQRVLKENGEVDWVLTQELYSTPSRELTCEEVEKQIHEGIDIWRYHLGLAPLTRDRETEAKIRASVDSNGIESTIHEFYHYEKDQNNDTAGPYAPQDTAASEIASYIEGLRYVASDRLALVVVMDDHQDLNPGGKEFFSYWT